MLLLSAQGAEFALGPLEGFGLAVCKSRPALRLSKISRSAHAGTLRSIAGSRDMQRYFSVGVTNLVSLMAAHRGAAGKNVMTPIAFQDEIARIDAELMANHVSTRTMDLYDRRSDEQRSIRSSASGCCHSAVSA